MAKCPATLSTVQIDTSKLPALVPISQVVEILTEFQAAHLADTDAYFACSVKQAGEAKWIQDELPPWGAGLP